MITHLVIFWVEGAEEEKRERLSKGAAALAEIPGVLEFRYGFPVSSPRPVVDDTFTVALSMTFPDQAAADAYQNHPVHQAFVEQYVKPLVSRLVVYDFAPSQG